MAATEEDNGGLEAVIEQRPYCSFFTLFYCLAFYHAHVFLLFKY